MITPDKTSPWSLLQEELAPDPWRVLIACKMLNQTSYKQVRQVIFAFFKKWPSAEAAKDADPEIMRELIRPLGFYNRRTSQIIRFSKEFLEKDWNKPSELYGIGKYAEDSYDIFIRRTLNVTPTDKKLIRYLEWAKHA